MTAKSYITQLEETIIQQQSRIETLENDNLNLEKDNLGLNKRLAFYENPNTPPSARKISDNKKPKRKSGNKKRGAPKGHRGATRKTPVPDEIIEVVAGECEVCGSKNITDLHNVDKHTIEDIPPPQEIKIIQYNRHKVQCGSCGHEFISKHPDCPKVGKFGIFLLVYITMLKYYLRGVLRKVQDILFYSHDFEISTKGIHDILLRVGDACKTRYEDNIRKIQNALWTHIDETGIKINGEKHWLWVFRTNNNEIIVVIRKSRGGKVLDEILGKDWKKPIIVDGWRSYWKYPLVQRCWAHLLRVVDDFKDISDEGNQLSKDIHRCFKKMRVFLDKDPSINDRTEKQIEFKNDMEKLVKKYKPHNELKQPLTYIENGLGKWYTCLKYPGMEPTNNLGEQAIRESVIVRKIIGCFRSKKGAENYQYIASLLASWKLQDKNIFEELEYLLRQELCLT